MPMRWTADQDQNFLMLIIETVKVDYKALASKWAERYPDGDKPTPKALEEHIGSLKRKAKKANGGTAVSTPQSNSKKSTPSSKRAAPKTLTSSAKRQKRQAAMSDEDDSEDERNMTINVPKREVVSRRGKPSKSYAEAESEDEGDDGLDGIPFTSAQPERQSSGPGSFLDSLTDTAAKSTETDSVLGTNGGLGNRGSKMTQPKYDYFSQQAADDSDNSDFNPMG